MATAAAKLPDQGDQPQLFEDKAEQAPAPAFENKEPEDTEAEVEIQVKPEKTDVSHETPPDDGVETIKKQLDEHKRQLAEANQRVLQEQQARQQALAQAQQNQQQMMQYQSASLQERLLTIQNAMTAAQAEAEKAQMDLEVAGNNGDWKAVGEAQRRLARTESNLTQLEAGQDQVKQQIEQYNQWAQQQQQQPPQMQQRQPTTEEIIRNSGLPQKARDWLMDHQDYISDSAKNKRILAIDNYATEVEGLDRSSDAYIEFIETKLGLRQAPSIMSGTEREPDQPVRQRERTAPVSAPVSRDVPSPSGKKTQPGQVRLTAEEREHARAAGITDAEYAKQKVRMQEAREKGLIQ